MYCPICQHEFACEDELYYQQEVTISDCFSSEIEVIFDCPRCGEQYIVTIAQEDLT